MRQRFIPLLLLAALGGCTSLFGDRTRSYSVYFQPYSTDLDAHAHQTVLDAAAFAQLHPLQPVFLVGYAGRPDPSKDVDGLSAQRAEVVKQALVRNGVRAGRISVTANGITDPEGKPEVAVRRVDINVGR
ncbi:OmpA family protein [Rhodopila globiformis]|nr:OmpA family protein [Rhodopila globiformis]